MSATIERGAAFEQNQQIVINVNGQEFSIVQDRGFSEVGTWNNNEVEIVHRNGSLADAIAWVLGGAN